MKLSNLAIICFCLLARDLFSGEVCKVQLNCPLNYKNRSITVDRDVVALDNVFTHCLNDSFVEGISINLEDTISVFFIIDHSASMSHMDSTGLRYSVARQLIDTLAIRSPQSEVGIAIFSNQLLHSYQDDPYYVQLQQETPTHEAYIPLTRLDASIDGGSAIEKLKGALATSTTPNDTDIGGNQRLLNGNYSPTGRHDSRLYPTYLINNGYNGTTDISLGFEAARQAFLSASYPRNRQFIIFLSDGVSQYVDVQRAEHEFDYINGANLPTTYTAFFININQTIPPQMEEMTVNIQNNGYSETNRTSEVWKTSGTVGELIQKLLRELSLGTGGGIRTRTPLSLSINGMSAIFAGDSVYLPKLIPLTGQSTTLDFTLSWHWNEPINSDVSETVSVTVVQGAIPSEALPKKCWDQGDLRFYSGNQQLSFVSEDQRTIEVRFYPSSDIAINNAVLVITNAEKTDSLTLSAVNNGQYFYGTFNRTYGAPIIDNILQNSYNDSIVAYYRNPDLPLDVLRASIAVAQPRAVGVQAAYFLDQNGNGYPDLIRVIQGEQKITAAEAPIIASYITFKPTGRELSIQSVVPSNNGFDIILNETGVPYTGSYHDERMYIERVTNLPSGGEFPATNVVIADSMAPVIIKATYYNNVNPQIRDTMEVFFSEAIRPVDSQEPFVFYTNSTEYRIRLSSEGIDSSKAVFSIVSVTGQQEPVLNDSINIDHSVRGISDLSGNVQNFAGNIKRKIDLFILYKITEAAYLDTTGDGLIDLVRVTMDAPPDEELLDVLSETITLPEYRKFTYTRSDLEITATGFVIKVRQPPSTEPYTTVDERDKLVVRRTEASNGGIIKETSVPIEDLLAPVLIQATYVPGKKDSLIARFSETISAPTSNQPFVLYDAKTGEPYTMTLHYVKQVSSTEQLFSIEQVNGKEYPEWKDSISINPLAGVKDTSNNIQDSENRRSELIFKAEKYDYTIVSLPNPFDPIKAEISASVRNYYNITDKEGLVIVAKPASRIAGHVVLRGKLAIYDAVGNKVLEIVSKETESNAKDLIFVWNGTNKKGRFVGTGTYLAVLTIEDNQGSVSVKKTKIGVKRTIIEEK